MHRIPNFNQPKKQTYYPINPLGLKFQAPEIRPDVGAEALPQIPCLSVVNSLRGITDPKGICKGGWHNQRNGKQTKSFRSVSSAVTRQAATQYYPTTEPKARGSVDVDPADHKSESGDREKLCFRKGNKHSTKDRYIRFQKKSEYNSPVIA